MPHDGINWLAVLVAAIIPMVVGGLWYSNLLFAKKWLALMGTTEEEIRKNFNPAKTYGITFIMCIILAYVMDYFVYYTLSMTFLELYSDVVEIHALCVEGVENKAAHPYLGVHFQTKTKNPRRIRQWQSITKAVHVQEVEAENR